MKNFFTFLLFTMCFTLFVNAQESLSPEADGFVRSNKTDGAYADRAELSGFRQIVGPDGENPGSVKEHRAIVLSFDLTKITVGAEDILDVQLEMFNVSAEEENEVAAAYELYVKQHELASDADLTWDALELSSGDEYTYGDRVLEFTLSNADIDKVNVFESDAFKAKIKEAKATGKKVAIIVTPQIQDLTAAMPTRKFAGISNTSFATPALKYTVAGSTGIAPEADGFVRSNKTDGAYADRAELSGFRQIVGPDGENPGSVKEHRAIVLSFDLSTIAAGSGASLDVQLELYNVSAEEETEIQAAYEMYVKQHELSNDEALTWDALELSSGDQYTYGERVLEFTLGNADREKVLTFKSDNLNTKINEAKAAGKKVVLIITPQIQDLTVAAPTRKFAGIAHTEFATPVLKYTVDNSTSIKDLHAQDVFFYPNPATDRLNIELGMRMGAARVSIYSLSGQALYYKEHIDSKVSIDVSGYKPGLYIINVESGQEIISSKLSIR